MVNVFNNPTKNLPKKDPQIVRVDFEQSEITGRKDHLPTEKKSTDMSVRHVESQG